MIDLSDIRKKIKREAEDAIDLLDKHDAVLQGVASLMAPFNVVSATVSGGSLDVSVTGDKHALQAIFGGLRRLGLEPSSRPVAGSPSFCAFWSDANGAKVWLNFSSTQCRRVKTGTVTVQQDVYAT